MAFGITRQALTEWKQLAGQGEIAFLTHFWLDERFPTCTSVTKVGCSNVSKLEKWGAKYGLKPEWIHRRDKYPHFDLLGDMQREILKKEGLEGQLINLGYSIRQ
ncbi:hypothetical protein JCM9140_362 [Halalkalibacter wakoensis JCM 9140]|uniref:Uncharacterized protein n=1 Tax=Halalkalibacter wakoensis JCM 9140 TaxID=1236970 RepID=W4PXP9_9BACI|nr:hypothetical protein [Halalkalibacter wakoensis]GAE24435.1 hypothetical protein JCM9140_362 [Halalkalibacter wakoensis JCM 9140]